MDEDNPLPSEQEPKEFDRLSELKQPMLLIEFLHFLKDQRKWWLVPLLIAFMVYATFLVVSISSGPVFIYRFF